MGPCSHTAHVVHGQPAVLHADMGEAPMQAAFCLHLENVFPALSYSACSGVALNYALLFCLSTVSKLN